MDVGIAIFLKVIPMDIEIMTLREVSQYLRVHEMTLYRWMKAKLVPGFKIGGRWRFKISEIDKWIKTQLEAR